MPKFKVTGHAFIPVEVAIEVEAPSGVMAMNAADIIWNRGKKTDFVVPDTEDRSAVYGFRAAEAEKLD